MRSSKEKGIHKLTAKDRPTTISIVFVLTFILIIALAHKQSVKNPVTVHAIEKITGGR
jgi:uncharacterized protein (DUF983 family)